MMICGVFFDEVGEMIWNKRTYNGCDLVGSGGVLIKIAEFEVDPKNPSFNKAHQKKKKNKTQNKQTNKPSHLI